MSAFNTFMAKIPATYVPEIEKAIDHAVQVLADPNAPESAYEAVLRELDQIQKMVGLDATEAWSRELRDELTSRLTMRLGIDRAAAQEIIIPKINDLLEKLETVRGMVQSKFWKLNWKFGLFVAEGPIS